MPATPAGGRHPGRHLPSLRLVTFLAMLLIFALALLLRTVPMQETVFGSGEVRFVGADPYYHMRLVDSLVRNFPRYITFDPYLYYPHGSTWEYMPFFDWLIAGVALLIGGGAPAAHTVDVVGAIMPAVLGALVVVPVYFIGREMFSRRAGLLGAALVAVLPGEFLGRSLLGAADHHVAEALFSATAVLFLLLAVKAAAAGGLGPAHLRRPDRASLRRPLLFSLLGGFCLGIYLLTWAGGPLFVFILFLYFIVQAVSDHLRGRSFHYLWVVGVPAMVVALVMVAPLASSPLPLVALAVALVTPLVLAGLSWWLRRRPVRPAVFPAAVAVAGVAGFLVLRFAAPGLLDSVLSRFSIFTSPGGVGATIVEVNPLLIHAGHFTLEVAWEVFAASFFLGLAGIGVLAFRVVKGGQPGHTLLLVWSLVVLAATLGERRFAYYFAVNAAVLSGWLLGRLVEVAGARAARAVGRPARRAVLAALALAIIFGVFVPVTGLPPAWHGKAMAAIEDARRLVPGDAWYSTLAWLRRETPEPFGDPGYYYRVYQAPPPGEDYPYPPTAYGVTAWWDYGHWITRVARRLPNHGPGGNWSLKVAEYFTASQEPPADGLLAELDSRYVVVDYDSATGKFHAIATFAGDDPDDYRGLYYIPDGDRLLPVVFFYPAYFRSMVVRLYAFEGKAVTPEKVMVISYVEASDSAGRGYRRVTSARTFPGYPEAVDFIRLAADGNYRIVSADPLVSPVPLEPLEHYRLVYASPETAEHLGRQVPTVKVFEYDGGRAATAGLNDEAQAAAD